MKYLLEGRKEDGSTVYYTGRAGNHNEWVSANRAESFLYDSLSLARRRATNFNQFTTIHGIRFHVPVGESGMECPVCTETIFRDGTCGCTVQA